MFKVLFENRGDFSITKFESVFCGFVYNDFCFQVQPCTQQPV